MLSTSSLRKSKDYPSHVFATLQWGLFWPQLAKDANGKGEGTPKETSKSPLSAYLCVNFFSMNSLFVCEIFSLMLV